jgi:hypothetical protein
VSEFATLSLGSDVSPDAYTVLLDELLTLPDVEDARALEQRAIDPASVMLIVEIAGGVLSAATSAWSLIDKIRTSLKKKNVTGATITLPNGTKIELDSVSEDQVARLFAGADDARG